MSSLSYLQDCSMVKSMAEAMRSAFVQYFTLAYFHAPQRPCLRGPLHFFSTLCFQQSPSQLLSKLQWLPSVTTASTSKSFPAHLPARMRLSEVLQHMFPKVPAKVRCVHQSKGNSTIGTDIMHYLADRPSYRHLRYRYY
jgi:hypothetical protein